MEKKIEAFELRFFCNILNVSSMEHRTNMSIRAEKKAAIGRHEHLLSTMRRRKMRWFGHINLSHGLANTIVQGAVDGVRRRGRPRTSWLGRNVIKWTGKTAWEIHTTSHNREEWREIIFTSSQTVPPRLIRTRDWEIGERIICFLKFFDLNLVQWCVFLTIIMRKKIRKKCILLIRGGFVVHI